MTPHSTTPTANLSREIIQYNMGSAKKENPFNLAKAVQYHEELEASCDEVIQKQDDLIRKVTHRCHEAGRLSTDKPGYAPLVSPTREEGEPGLSAQDHSASLAPMASQAFILQANDDEADCIEQWEFDIGLLRQRMRLVEDEIVKHAPVTPVDVARKMKFLAGLVADGGEVDMDAFSRLVLEGSEMLLTALGEVGFF
ncbi:MAG: hypothetical protein WAT25_00640 [Paracoccaceae bacterium]